MDIANGRYWDKAWSLVDGCTPVSEACDHCWLEGMNSRFKKWIPGTVTPRVDRLDIPLHTRKPTVFAVWSDLFHESVPDEFIDEAHRIMLDNSRHTYLILTKRTRRMAEFYDSHNDALYFDAANINIWRGTTVENQEQADKRIPELLLVPGKKFLSIEPMLMPVNLRQCLKYEKTCHPSGDDFCNGCSHSIPIKNIHAVILGGESGHGARPIHPDWA